ncbi:MAG: alpha/beta hydrolase [Pseudomonadota bacterium]
MAQSAPGYRTIITQSWVEEWDPQLQSWVRVEDGVEAPRARVETAASMPSRPERAQASARPIRQALAYQSRPSAPRGVAQYGPFLVLDERRAAMMGSTDTASPRHFDAMMRDFPGLTVLEMIEAPGTSNDIANLEVGRKIRAHGLATHVPRGGSVRSGAVELFLAGVTKTIERGALFAVHSWLDNYGREPDDFAADAPANRLYLDYYREMGMSEARARAFYAMTNSVPHHSAKWLRADEMRGWIRPEFQRQPPRLAYRDVSLVAITGFGDVFSQPFLDS